MVHLGILLQQEEEKNREDPNEASTGSRWRQL